MVCTVTIKTVNGINEDNTNSTLNHPRTQNSMESWTVPLIWKHVKWHSYQINSQNEGGHFPDPKTPWSHSSHCLSVHTGNIKTGSKFSAHSFPTCLQPLALHTVCTVAESAERAAFIFWYQKSRVLHLWKEQLQFN